MGAQQSSASSSSSAKGAGEDTPLKGKELPKAVRDLESDGGPLPFQWREELFECRTCFNTMGRCLPARIEALSPSTETRAIITTVAVSASLIVAYVAAFSLFFGLHEGWTATQAVY